ncbi:hypothetical protein [Ramlibacter sp. WS9]|uniref:hypothetical protein n=1 Tax=Ramlibacter sp. WS9 TaxID=1882741 RepID=UPI0011416AEA|nr:hypothetical protein [Ramlibacter sp. WS9]ROZ75063.1 hypothetical protein EEB15_16960 [Ramlibacter sp. WS9]
MINIDENTITQAVIDRLAGCEQPRLKHVLSCLVHHLHDFARDHDPGPAADGTLLKEPFYTLDFNLVLARAGSGDPPP